MSPGLHVDAEMGWIGEEIEGDGLGEIVVMADGRAYCDGYEERDSKQLFEGYAV